MPTWFGWAGVWEKMSSKLLNTVPVGRLRPRERVQLSTMMSMMPMALLI